jgi:hypothetical protein
MPPAQKPGEPSVFHLTAPHASHSRPSAVNEQPKDIAVASLAYSASFSFPPVSRSLWRRLSRIRQDVREEHSRQPCVGGREGRGPGESSAYLLLVDFDKHKAHSRSLNSLAAGLRVGGIMFLGFDVGSDIASRHQSGVMTELRQLARPEMRSAANFEADKARRNIDEETQHLASSKLSSENRPAIGVDAVHLDQIFDVSRSDRWNRHRTTPCFVW